MSSEEHVLYQLRITLSYVAQARHVSRLLRITGVLSITGWLAMTEHVNPCAENLFSSEKRAINHGYRYLGGLSGTAHGQGVYRKREVAHWCFCDSHM